MKAKIVTAANTRVLDVYRVATSLVERYGDDAALVAERWSDCAVRAGDPARAAAWRSVVNTVTGKIAPSATRTRAGAGTAVAAVAA